VTSDDMKKLTDLVLAEWFEQKPGESLEEAMERRMELRRQQSIDFLEVFRKAAKK
jgi:hypothetical protein